MFFKKKEKTAALSVDDRLKHIAFIMDGNGRWAQKRGLPREYGHAAGAKTFRKIALYCGDIGIKYVTIYAFSTENWKRPEREVKAIMKLLSDYLDEALRDLDKNNVRYIFIGDKGIFDEELRSKMINLEKVSESKPLTLNFAVNYGGRDEIVKACRELILEGNENITADDVSRHLYTALSPDPDIIVRTGGEQRLSNFLLWQASYAEFYFTETLWPDLSTADIDSIVSAFYGRDRRYGRIKEDTEDNK